jgi:TonB family protein
VLRRLTPSRGAAKGVRKNMPTSRGGRVRLVALALFAWALIFPHGPASKSLAQEQAPGRVTSDAAGRGVRLIKQGDFKAAIDALRAAVKQDEADADAWHYLGVAYHRAGDAKESRKAFEKAVKLRPDFADAHAGLAYALLSANRLREAERKAAYVLILTPKNLDAHYVLGVVGLRSNDPSRALKEAEAALQINPGHASALFLKTQALLAQTLGDMLDKDEEPAGVQRRRLNEASATTEKLIALNPKAPGVAEWREQLETIRVYVGLADNDDPSRTVFKATDVTQKAVVLFKPPPGYSTEARAHLVSGVVKLRMILAADGQVKHILVIRGLPDGLTERAVAAARQIKFRPALREGKPVSQAITIEYSFNTY